MKVSRVPHWSEGPQIRELKSILDIKLQRMKRKLKQSFDKTKVPNLRFLTTVTKSKGIPNPKIPSPDQLAQSSSSGAAPVSKPANVRVNTAITYSHQLPEIVRELVEKCNH